MNIKVRHYELDTLGHVNHAVYLQYADVARSEFFESVGGREPVLRAAKLAPVLLETHVVYRRELRAGDTMEVTCDAKFGGGKTFDVNSNIYKPDGRLSAEVRCTFALMDLERRKLVDDPRGHLERAGVVPDVLSIME